MWSNSHPTQCRASCLSLLFLSGSTSVYSACSSQRELLNYQSVHLTLLLKRFHQLPMILRINPCRASPQALHDLAALLRPLPPFHSMLQTPLNRLRVPTMDRAHSAPRVFACLFPLENPSTRTASGSLPSLNSCFV